MGPSLPPCSLLVVSGGGLPYLHCQWSFDDRSRSPPLLFFTVRFQILGVCYCGFSTDLAGPCCTRPALRWPGISPVASVPPPLLSPHFADGCGGPGVLGFHGSGSLGSLPALFVLSTLLFRGNFVTFFFFFFYIILYNGLCSSLIFV